MEGTPYAVRWGPFLSFLDVPCQRPPYGRLTAIDVNPMLVLPAGQGTFAADAVIEIGDAGHAD